MKILEAKYIRIFSFFFDKEDGYDEYKEEVIRRVKAMVDYADENGIMCCHENEKGIYGDTAERCLEVLEACGGKLRAVFDPANFVQCGVDTLKAYELLEDYIEYMHVKDALYADGQVVPAGEGDGNVEEIIRKLSFKWKRIILSLEPHLKVFEGFNALENDDETKKGMDKHTYATYKESFKAAADAMHKLVEKAQPIRTGIVGVGNMGSSHIRNFLDGEMSEMRVTAVASVCIPCSDAVVNFMDPFCGIWSWGSRITISGVLSVGSRLSGSLNRMWCAGSGGRVLRLLGFTLPSRR